jgi:15-cis-phytoene synthase
MQQISASCALASAADAAACASLLRGGSRTFFAASLVLPKGIRAAAISLYAFCRVADDAIDTGTDRELALKDLRSRLDGIYSGAPCDNAADRAFADAVTRHNIPKNLPGALLEGFEWDALNRRYENITELYGYGTRVAGTVGMMMAMVMGVRSRTLLARACDLGVAMQLTNIARDVGEDARCGRLYLPLDWMRAAGLDPERWLANPVFTEKLGDVIQQVLRAADELYRRADAGLAKLPAACRPGMFAARLLYAEIGREVARRGYDSVSQRAVVPWQLKMRLLLDAVREAGFGRRECSDAPLNECLFLLNSLAESAESPPVRARRPGVQDRVVWLAQLFERLERREHAL